MSEKRVIKFRVWDKKFGRMYSDGISVQGDGAFYLERADHDGHGIEIAESEHGELVLMQFTGLKDKNGKEIYEGDVIEAKSWSPMRYAVEFIEGGFCFTHPKLKGSPIDINLVFSSTGCACEVIGNIYEHEHLKP